MDTVALALSDCLKCPSPPVLQRAVAPGGREAGSVEQEGLGLSACGPTRADGGGQGRGGLAPREWEPAAQESRVGEERLHWVPPPLGVSYSVLT